MKRLIVAALAALLMGAPIGTFADVSSADTTRQVRANDNPDTRRGFLAFLKSGTKKRKKTDTLDYSREWIEAQPVPTGNEDFLCLSEALYFEARGETVRGQFAVAEVIMNRVSSSKFPDSACRVIRQGTGRKYQCQFTYTCDGHKEVIAEKAAYLRVAKVARAVIDGHGGGLTDGAMFYHTTGVRPKWSRTFTKTAQIGVHIFYRPHTRTASNQ